MNILPTELEPIANHILFQFEDETHKTGHRAFKEKTDWGFQLPSTVDDTTKRARWATIVGLGPEVSNEFQIGQRILIDALRWTQQVEYKGVTFARTDPEQILAIDDEV